MTKLSGLIKKLAMARTAMGFVVVGIIMTVISVVGIMAPEKEMITVQAVIDDIIEMPYDSLNNTQEYKTIISYTDLNGVKHENIEYVYNSGDEVGGNVEIMYDAENPELVSSPGMGHIEYITLIAGIAALGFGLFKAHKTINTSIDDLNQYDRTSKFESNPVEYNSDNSTDNAYSGTENEYYFHFYGKMNQSYIMETPERRAVYKADCEKFSLMGSSTYNFMNCLTGETVAKQIGKSMTILQDNVATESAFKIDGVDCWDVLGSMGYSIDVHFEGIKICYTVKKNGSRVAEIKIAGTNILKDGRNSKLAEMLPSRGLYKIYCTEQDIEACFLVAFIDSRTDFTM